MYPRRLRSSPSFTERCLLLELPPPPLSAAPSPPPPPPPPSERWRVKGRRMSHRRDRSTGSTSRVKRITQNALLTCRGILSGTMGESAGRREDREVGSLVFVRSISRVSGKDAYPATATATREARARSSHDMTPEKA